MPRLIGAAQIRTTQAEQITTFNSSGTLTTQPLTTAVEHLVVAGGGGGGLIMVAAEVQGVITASGNPVSGSSPYPVTVGAGGRRCLLWW